MICAPVSFDDTVIHIAFDPGGRLENDSLPGMNITFDRSLQHNVRHFHSSLYGAGFAQRQVAPGVWSERTLPAMLRKVHVPANRSRRVSHSHWQGGASPGGDVEFVGGLHLDGSIAGNVRSDQTPGATLSVRRNRSIEGAVEVPNVMLKGTVKVIFMPGSESFSRRPPGSKAMLYYGVIEMTWVHRSWAS